MKKICLVYPKSMTLPKYFHSATNISTDNDETLPPLGILYLISNSKYKIDFLDNRIQKKSIAELYNQLVIYDIVGFGGTIFEIKEARNVSIKLMKSGVKTIYGGSNATVNWNLYINCFNIICRGEGEGIFDQIIDNINNLKNLGFIQVGNTYVNDKVYRKKNLDSIKFPDRNVIDLDDYKRIEPAYLNDVYPVDTVVSSRGCPFDCYFCSSKLIWNRKYTFRSIDNIISEIQYLIKNYATKGIYFREDNFTVVRKRVIEFCEKIKNLNVSWLCESRVDTLDEELIELMANSGCKGIWFGLESTDDHVLKQIGKMTTVDQISKTIKICNNYGIRTGGGFMIGFPFDTYESILKNYKNSKKLGLSVRFYNRVWAVPVSEMYYEILEKGLDYFSFENIILPSTETLSAEELNDLYYKLVSRKVLFDKKISKILGTKTVKYIKSKFPIITKYYRKILDIL